MKLYYKAIRKLSFRTERRIAQAAHSDLAAMISAVVGSIPMVGRRKGTTRETVQRPMAYLYARRDAFKGEDRSMVTQICATVTGLSILDVARLRGPLRVDTRTRVVSERFVWLRLNGELSSANWLLGREAWRTMDGRPEAGGWAWALHLAIRSGSDPWCAKFQAAQSELREVAPVMEGTLPGWLLVLRWSPALAMVVKWRRRNGCDLGPQMLVRWDQAMIDGHVPPEYQEEIYRLCRLDPATSQLARAIMAVEPREDGVA